MREKTEPNDTYVSQLVAGAEAATNKVVRLGAADRDRLAIGGHSYGAFTTANLLAHSDLFRAGIARSGAYNRTLTPFGFQAEERNFWQARQLYIDMSPFAYADKIDEPLLMIHGDVAVAGQEREKRAASGESGFRIIGNAVTIVESGASNGV